MSAPTTAASQAPATRTRIRSSWLWVLVAVLLAATVGYLAGRSQGQQVQVLRGTAQVGDHVASIQVGDWAYGVSDSVAWYDAAGSWHEGGWPECLPQVTEVAAVRFAATTVTRPDGSTFRPVAYVDCRP